MPPTLSTVKENIDKLRDNLKQEINFKEVSISEKTPFKALWSFESTKWRIAELAESSYEELIKKRYLGAAVNIRACIESVSLLWYLNKKINRSLEQRNIDEIDEKLDSLLLGCRTLQDMPNSINIMTFIETIGKDMPVVKSEFENLCELAHPSWLGTTICFSEPNESERTVQFSKYARMPDLEKICLINLNCSLLTTELACKQFASSFENFISLCENG